ncbi:hypothetical protein [Nannocystis sp. SCPEA4]|uniref:hypothetical protein n=1 Tax=Nannocystis sp. SCPEA4 TaxID=2996787 RepID=UPI00226DC405|nr:hypothetical protein [Nannocystis sp. SCPEA4]MCY1057260.1 hypothetical protein [Nannocystis sp. SCPEA4]
MTGCAASSGSAATAPAAAAATAELTVSYRGEPLSSARIVARLGQEARIDTTTDDGHSAAVRLLIEDAGAGNYRTAVDVQYDGATIGSNQFLSAPGQSAAAESEELRLELRVSPT